jgi:YebC/PmpR family DNA-binding regulatory protein
MSGHSKWATTKHRKAAVDSKRSALFSKLSRIITVAAKTGGDPKPENNASLAAAIAKAKGYSLPKEKIQAAIDKAFSAAGGANYEEIVYEGYGSNGVAVFAEALTDNRNRTAADVRSAFTRAGGSLGATGSVAYQFERTGEIVIDKSAAPDEEALLMAVMEAGGNDLEDNDDEFVVLTGPSDIMAVKAGLEAQGIEVRGAEISMRPKTPVAVDVATARKVLRLVDALEELDDIQDVYHNMEMTEELAAALEE